MTGAHSNDLHSTDFLADADWRLTWAPAGRYVHPDELPDDSAGDLVGDDRWMKAEVPGTAASSAVRAGVVMADIDELDWWYSTTASVPTNIATELTFEGVATRATVWIGRPAFDEVARIRSMFVPETVDVPAGEGDVRIVVRVESMAAHLKTRRPRGRWRSSLVAQQGLRHERTTLLGRAPVYGPLQPPVGLWRPVTLREPTAVSDVRVGATAAGGYGRLHLRARIESRASTAVLHIGDHSWVVSVDENFVDAVVTVTNVMLWWPHTHGDPTLYPWSLELDGAVVCGGRVGFRSVELNRDDRAVTLTVNGIRTFARGGCWVPPDAIRLWVDAAAMRTELQGVRDAGLNMVRVVGTMVYEQAEFWSLCAELGIMVWQDVMFATTDPPEGAEFVDTVERELSAFTAMVGGNPALTVVSGGSETQQQPTMLGLPTEDQRIPLLQNAIPAILDAELPGTPYVTSSPSSTTGELHTHVGDGIAHYFGVGGYLRPLSDVRSARVRFAAECLAFAVPPERRAVDTMFGSANVAGHHPQWKDAVPRDRGSSWDFEDVRDHYVREIFGVDPHLVRRDDAELYLDYGRAAVCEAVTVSYMHWRRTGSECTGALVLTLRDLVPGAGWGLLDSTGAKKAPWYSLARLSSPVAVFVVDDGLDGLTIELLDDTPEPVIGTLHVELHRSGGSSERHEMSVALDARSATSIPLDRVIGTFADVNHSYRFGAQTYAAVHATVVDDRGRCVAEATHLVGDRQDRQNDVGLEAHAAPSAPGQWELTVSTQWPAQYVCVDVDGVDTSDSWFHLAPGTSRVLTLTGDGTAPSGHVRALNSIKRTQIVRAETA
ncbi:MAG: glycoside hydrolase family 2 protein [Rhodococcus sp. (in: high G+C Gram-positive bacteria)]